MKRLRYGRCYGGWFVRLDWGRFDVEVVIDRKPESFCWAVWDGKGHPDGVWDSRHLSREMVLGINRLTIGCEIQRKPPVTIDDILSLYHEPEPVTLAVQREMWTQAQVADRRALLEDGTYQADYLDALLQCFDENEMSA